ncbi:MAG: sugar ABC transporter permease [Fimbriimonadaceae bacterium]|nr:sugar ABC transporter permease [Fimbriimonadaceae bacterium]
MKRSRIGYLFVAPAFVHLLVFALIPILYALYLSFFKWHILKEEKPFVGMQNYVDAVTDPPFWNAMWNSLRYTLVSVPVGLLVALLVAILVNQKMRGMTIFRTIYYIPSICSGVAIAMMWIYIYLPTNGLISGTLNAIGIKNEINLLNNVATAMWALVFMSIWTGLGPRMVLFLAGLVGIPQSLYEAAQLDGANKLREFWSITLPMLAPTTMFVVITSTISAMQIFTPVYMMTKGGPEGSTDVIGYHIYTDAWQKFHIGLASSKSFLLLIAILAVSVFQYRLMKRQMEGYSAG